MCFSGAVGAVKVPQSADRRRDAFPPRFLGVTPHLAPFHAQRWSAERWRGRRRSPVGGSSSGGLTRQSSPPGACVFRAGQPAGPPPVTRRCRFALAPCLHRAWVGAFSAVHPSTQGLSAGPGPPSQPASTLSSSPGPRPHLQAVGGRDYAAVAPLLGAAAAGRRSTSPSSHTGCVRRTQDPAAVNPPPCVARLSHSRRRPAFGRAACCCLPDKKSGA